MKNNKEYTEGDFYNMEAQISKLTKLILNLDNEIKRLKINLRNLESKIK